MKFYAIWIKSSQHGGPRFEPSYMRPHKGAYYNKVPRLFDNLESAKRSKKYFDDEGHYVVEIHELSFVAHKVFE